MDSKPTNRGSIPNGTVFNEGTEDEWVYWTEPAGPLCPFGHPWGIERQLRELHNEIDCRIEHGAESGGHLEYVRGKLAVILLGF